MGWGVFLAGQIVGSLRRIKYQPVGALDKLPSPEQLLEMELKEQKRREDKLKAKQVKQVKKDTQKTKIIRF
jgi:hypothetical protein